MVSPTPPGPPPPPSPPPQALPLWVLIVGAIFGFVTLAFFMAIALLPMAGFPIPCDSRFPIIVVLAICAAFASGFLGSYAKAEGSLPIPGANISPVTFGVGGGLAALLIVLILGYWLYVANCVPAEPPNLGSAVLSGDADNPVLTLKFDARGLSGHYIVRPEFSPDKSFSKPEMKGPIETPDGTGVEAHVVPPSGVKSGWVRLSVYDTTTSTVPRSHSKALEYKLP